MRAPSSVLTALLPLVAALMSGCDATRPQIGAIRITVATSGEDVDPDGYRVRVDAQPEHPVEANATVVIAGLSAGSRLVRLQGLAVNCLLGGDSQRSITVVADDTVTAEFAVGCSPLIGSVRLAVSSTGFDLDPDGYTVTLDDGAARAVEGSGTLLFENIREGLHNVTLGGVATNCIVLYLNPAPVLVTYAAMSELTIPVRCNWRPGSIRVTVSTTGDSLDTDGYLVVAQRSNGLQRSARVDATGTVTLDSAEVDDYSVSLVNVAGNCSVSGGNPRSTSVVTRQTTDLAFSASCTRLGNIRLRTATTGVDVDPDGYDIRITRADSQRTAAIGSNAAVTINGFMPGDYSVALEGTTVNCDAAAPGPRVVRVVSGATLDVTFDVACVRATTLAYWSRINNKAELHLVSSNGTAVTRLTPNTGDNVEPSWSPDGSKIAFRSDRDGNYEIYVMSASGVGVAQRLTNNPGADYDPAWSPDGSKIAFVSERDGSADIFVMNTDGSNVVRLTTHQDFDGEPAWSPDGSRIVFRSDRAGNAEIHVMNADGSGTTRLTNNDGFDGQPAWSPDGTRIAFAREITCDDYYYYYCQNNIHVMNADGTGVTRLESGLDDSQPTWSPDGRWLAFAAQQCDYYECVAGLWAAKLTGANRIQIVGGSVGNPAWQR